MGCEGSWSLIVSMTTTGVSLLCSAWSMAASRKDWFLSDVGCRTQMLKCIADLTGQKIRFKASGKEFIVEDRAQQLLSKELKILLLFLQDDSHFLYIYIEISEIKGVCDVGFKFSSLGICII